MSVVELEREIFAPDVTRADVLERAADIIEEWGWTRVTGMPGSYGRWTRKPVCFLGSIAQAAADMGYISPRGTGYFVAAQVLGKHIDDVHEFWRWNDARGRTQAEVVAALRTAAKEARA